MDSRLCGLLVQSNAQSRSIPQSWPHLDGVSWLLITAALCLLLHFASLSHTWSERQVMLMQEEKGREPKPQSCPPHLISEITALGAVAKPAANHGIYSLAQKGAAAPALGALYCSLQPPSVSIFGVGTCGSWAVEH